MRLLRYSIAFCFLTFVVTTIALALARPDMSVLGNQISDLLEGEFAALARAAFIILAAGAAGLGCVQSRYGHIPIASVLGVYSLATLTAGLTPPNAPVHNVAALTAFLAVAVAVGVAPFIRRTRRAPLIAVILATFATWPLGVGLGERITVYGEVGLMAWIALSNQGQPPVTE
jgi:hypothetical protein